MTKETKNIICEDCDSEYTLKFARNMVSGKPTFCPYCGTEAEEGETELDDIDEDDVLSDDDY